MNKKLIFLIISPMMFIGCDKKSEQESTTSYSKEKVLMSNNSDHDNIRPTLLGKKLENPFSVENMKTALKMVLEDENATEKAGIKTNSLDEFQIEPTNLYVRFFPNDTIQYLTLQADTTLILFDFPLDYKIEQSGDYYIQKENPDPIFKWYYATVNTDFIPIEGIKYEVLEELFIPENSPYYSEEIIPENLFASKAADKLFDINFVNAITIAAFHLTGNQQELENVPNNQVKPNYLIRECTNHTFLWKKWTTCDNKYVPDGYIKVNTPNGDVGLAGVRVVLWRWFTSASATTRWDGYYVSDKKWNSLWIGNEINYKIVFVGRNNNSEWNINKSVAGALCLWTNEYSMGYQNPASFSKTIYSDNEHWGKCVISNAVYEYIAHADRNKLAVPNSIDIAVKKSDDLTSSAPLASKHLNYSLAFSNWYWGAFANLTGYNLLGWGLPDLILRYQNNLSKYNVITSVVWHEMTHACNVQRIRQERGLLTTSDIWSRNVFQQVFNSLNNADKSPYGKKGDENWQIIALSEGWANYFVDYLARSYLRNYERPGFLGFPRMYVKMFQELVKAKCSIQNIEKALCYKNIEAFKNRLIELHPNLRNDINSIVKEYE